MAAGRLRAVVLLGRDRDVIRGSLARHAPQVPIVDVTAPETGHMGSGPGAGEHATEIWDQLGLPG